MKINNISEGMRISNYKKLCELLEESVKKGNSKNAQLKEWERHFCYRREGNAYIIEEIYSVPKTISDGRQKYLHLIEPILLNYLASCTEHSSEETWSRWYRNLGMIGDRFYDERYCEEVRETWRAHPYTLYRTKNVAANKMKEILSSALSNMSKRGLVAYKEQWRIIDQYGCVRDQTDFEPMYIERVRRGIMEEMGYDSLTKIYLSPKRAAEYNTRLHDLFWDSMRWRNVYKVLVVEAVDGVATTYRDIDVNDLKKELNRKIKAAVNNEVIRIWEKEGEKMLDAWEQEEYDNLENLKNGFSLPEHFHWDAAFLIDQLMEL